MEAVAIEITLPLKACKTINSQEPQRPGGTDQLYLLGLEKNPSLKAHIYFIPLSVHGILCWYGESLTVPKFQGACRNGIGELCQRYGHISRWGVACLQSELLGLFFHSIHGWPVVLSHIASSCFNWMAVADTLLLRSHNLLSKLWG